MDHNNSMICDSPTLNSTQPFRCIVYEALAITLVSHILGSVIKL